MNSQLSSDPEQGLRPESFEARSYCSLACEPISLQDNEFIPGCKYDCGWDWIPGQVPF